MSAPRQPLDALRRPFLVAALLCVVASFCICLGAPLLVAPPPFDARVDNVLSNPQTQDLLDAFDLDADDVGDALADASPDSPPGLGIPALALINAVLVLVLALTAARLLIGDRAVGAVQGIVSVVVGLVGLLCAVGVALASFTALLAMVSLLVSAPFGTLAYLAVFGSFPVGSAAVLVGLILVLQLSGLVCLALAQQRFLTSKGLVLLFASAAALTIVTGLLHSFVPGFMASITDALAALISAVVAAVWFVLQLVLGIVAVLRVLQLGRQTSLRTQGAASEGQDTTSTESSS
ncbi:hypothetical protein SAMN02745244_01706 [Tessaracoccus bendigoensis DSM 12906]|uniref:Uncharacterized protein n=1 Tax=Tessaracoccus bendigoensis DSM 12906 TaxID=1123357 RepID=A0A1M6GGD5_9ACTN|nr:hypothetical protein [Tessaracoccus bendigoensis]SHJ08977.1 hypothetical protein SAMN02745244_01706 [Tessaracoccus bendigoensis DSM 12906]